MDASPNVSESLSPSPTLFVAEIGLKLIEPSASGLDPPLIKVPVPQVPDVLLPLQV